MAPHHPHTPLCCRPEHTALFLFAEAACNVSSSDGGLNDGGLDQLRRYAAHADLTRATMNGFFLDEYRALTTERPPQAGVVCVVCALSRGKGGVSQALSIFQNMPCFVERKRALAPGIQRPGVLRGSTRSPDCQP